MRAIVSLILFMLLPFVAMAKEKTENIEFDYQIEGAGTGIDGTYLVRVWVMCEKPRVTDKVIGKYAVKGVLFKGFSSKENRQKHHPPLAGSALAEQQHADFFDAFFSEGGAYSNYIQVISNSRKVVKLGKDEYKVGATVTVLSNQLRKDLEKAGIIRALGSGM